MTASTLYPLLRCGACGREREHRVLGLERGTGKTSVECSTCQSMQTLRLAVPAPAPSGERCAALLEDANADARLLEAEVVRLLAREALLQAEVERLLAREADLQARTWILSVGLREIIEIARGHMGEGES